MSPRIMINPISGFSTRLVFRLSGLPPPLYPLEYASFTLNGYLSQSSLIYIAIAVDWSTPYPRFVVASPTLSSESVYLFILLTFRAF